MGDMEEAGFAGLFNGHAFCVHEENIGGSRTAVVVEISILLLDFVDNSIDSGIGKPSVDANRK
jgi:hypothetical protein